MRYFTLLFLIFLYVQANATNYYFANTGKDNNKGTSMQSPWKNISKINQIKLKAGDSVLLKRGDFFEGSVKLNQSGTASNPIVIAAYGTGNLPVLSGAKRLKNWNSKKDIYTAKINHNVSDLYVNDQKQILARYPNTGFIILDSAKNKQTLYSNRILEIPGLITGAFVRLRSIDWVYEIRKVISSTPNSITLGYHNLYEEDKSSILRTSNGEKTIYELKKGYGFYVDGLPQFIDVAKEWSMSGREILYKPQAATDMQNDKIEAVVNKNGIEVASGLQNIRIENIQIEKYFYAAIIIGTSVQKININNCNIKNTHVYGIYMDSLSKDCKIINNKISNILGKGIAIMEPENMVLERNSVKNIGLEAGQGFSGINGASAITIINHEHKTIKKSKYANHNKVRFNHVDSCGYNGVRVDGSYNLVEYNLIENCGLTLNDGSALYCYATQPGITHHQIFRRNIVKNSRGNNDATPSNDIHFDGIYIDNNSHDMLIEENTSINHSSAGLMNNVASFNNSFINNNVFNCNTGMGISEWGDRIGKTYGNKVFYNTIVGLDSNQYLIKNVSYVASKAEFAIYDKNTYIHTTNTNPFYHETYQIPENSKLNLPFNFWQAIGSQDKNSHAIMADNPLLKDFAPEIIINDGMATKEYNLNNDNYRDAKGEDITIPIKLGAYQSVIVLKRK